MEPHKTKTLADLPQITVTAVRVGLASDAGYTYFEIDVSFDGIPEMMNGNWFWALFGERECACVSVQSLDRERNTAVLTFEDEAEPQILGKQLACLSPYWQAFHVWMVLEPRWIWERKEVQGTDAVAEDYEADDVSLIEGREIKVWTKIEPAAGGRGQTRYYPAEDQTLPVRPGTRIVPSVWDHEHCELCRAHIHAGEFGYCDLSEHWLCEECHRKYVVPHDLAFIDEL